MSARRVVVVGAGSVGSALGANLVRLGHEVRHAVRAGSSRPLPEGATAVPIEGAAARADLVVLAVPFDTVEGVLPTLGLTAGQVLVDTTNPFGRSLPAGHSSGSSVVAAAVGEGVRVVKAFNVLGAENMADPVLPDGSRPVLPVAGDDDAARATVVGLAREMGFDAVDVGGLAAAGLLEDAARYWGLLAFAGGLGRSWAFVVGRR